MLLVLPFDNFSGAPGIDWIGESFPEILGNRMKTALLFVIGRDERNSAFDHLGVPTNVRLSRATLYKIAEQMDTDLLVFGNYSFDGRTFTARAQLLDMKRLKLLPQVSESGALTSLIEIEQAIAWDLLHEFDPHLLTPRSDFLNSAPNKVRLDALENCIRGMTATDDQEKIKHLKQAIRVDPEYTLALLQLGKIYYSRREYDVAATLLAKIPLTDSGASEANFYRGLSEYYLGKFDKAEEAFRFVSTKIPLTEVFNNLGVVAGKRNEKAASEYFQRAIQADPNDADYHFNLALTLARTGDMAAATHQLKEALSLRPADQQAKLLLLSLAGAGPSPLAKLPGERMKYNYAETSYRQAELQLQRVQAEHGKNRDESQRGPVKQRP